MAVNWSFQNFRCEALSQGFDVGTWRLGRGGSGGGGGQKEWTGETRGRGEGKGGEGRKRAGRGEGGTGVGVWRVTLLLQILVSPIRSSW